MLFKFWGEIFAFKVLKWFANDPVFTRPLLHRSLLSPRLPQPWPPHCNRPRYWVQVFGQWFVQLIYLFCTRSSVVELYEQFQLFSESDLLAASPDPTLRFFQRWPCMWFLCETVGRRKYKIMTYLSNFVKSLQVQVRGRRVSWVWPDSKQGNRFYWPQYGCRALQPHQVKTDKISFKLDVLRCFKRHLGIAQIAIAWSFPKTNFPVWDWSEWTHCRMRVSEDYQQQLNIGAMRNLLRHFRSLRDGG